MSTSNPAALAKKGLRGGTFVESDVPSLSPLLDEIPGCRFLGTTQDPAAQSALGSSPFLKVIDLDFSGWSPSLHRTTFRARIQMPLREDAQEYPVPDRLKQILGLQQRRAQRAAISGIFQPLEITDHTCIDHIKIDAMLAAMVLLQKTDHGNSPAEILDRLVRQPLNKLHLDDGPHSCDDTDISTAGSPISDDFMLDDETHSSICQFELPSTCTQRGRYKIELDYLELAAPIPQALAVQATSRTIGDYIEIPAPVGTRRILLCDVNPSDTTFYYVQTNVRIGDLLPLTTDQAIAHIEARLRAAEQCLPGCAA